MLETQVTVMLIDHCSGAGYPGGAGDQPAHHPPLPGPGHASPGHCQGMEINFYYLNVYFFCLTKRLSSNVL